MAKRSISKQTKVLLKYATYKAEDPKGTWTCNKCNHKQKGRPYRIRSHLLGVKDRGVKVCEKMNTWEKEELAKMLEDALLEDNNDGVKETNAGVSGMSNTINQGQSSQPDSPQTTFPQGGMHLNMHPSRDGATAGPSRAANSMDTEGQGQQQQQLGEQYDSLNNMGNRENTSSIAVGSDVCPDREHQLNVPAMGIANVGGSEMINTVHQVHKQHFQPDSTQISFPQEGLHMSMHPSQDGSDPTEAEMPRGGASNFCSAPRENISVSGENTWNLATLEKSFPVIDLQHDSSEHNSAISVSALIRSRPETPDVSMTVPPELRTVPGPDQQRAYERNADNDGVEEANAVGPEMVNTTHQAQSSQSDSIRVSSLQGGRDMGMGDSRYIPPPQVSSDHMNDQHMHPLQDGVGSNKSTPGNGFGVGMASSLEVDDEPPPSPPPGFDADLWKFYLGLDTDFALYKDCMSSHGMCVEKILACLKDACYEVRRLLTDDPSKSEVFRHLSMKFYIAFNRVLTKELERLHGQVHHTEMIERAISGERELGIQMLGRRRNNEMERWLGYAKSFKSDVDDLNIDAEKAKSLEEMQLLLKRIESLKKDGDMLIEMGTLIVRRVSWNRNCRSCGSQSHNQMNTGQFPQQV